MKTKTISRAGLALLPAILSTLTSCSSTSNPPPPVGSATGSPEKLPLITIPAQ